MSRNSQSRRIVVSDNGMVCFGNREEMFSDVMNYFEGLCN